MDGLNSPAGTIATVRLRTLLIVVGLLISSCWLAAVVLARAGQNPILVYNGTFAVSFALFLLAAAQVVKLPASTGRQTVLLILGLALLPRLILLCSTPALSDDLYRYIWDGRVSTHGINPYHYAPDDPALLSLRDPIWERVNQKSQHTPYPPAAQAVFALTYQLAPDSVKAQQVVATLGDLAVIAALVLLLQRLRLPAERVLLYAWSPTPLLHFAHSGHNDPLMLAGVVLALALGIGPRQAVLTQRLWSGGILAVAALVKIIPLLLVLPLLRRWRLVGMVAFLAFVLVGSIPMITNPATLIGLSTEAGEAVFNDSLHLVLLRLFSRLTPQAGLATGLVTIAVLGAVACWLAWRSRTDTALIRGAATILGLALLLNAVVEPWYFAWLLPFVAVLLAAGPGRWPFAFTPLLGWLWASGASQLTDLTYLHPANVQFWPLIRLIEYGPLALLLLLAATQIVQRQMQLKSALVR